MNVDYNDVLKRLIEERHRLSKTQKEMGQCARMNQSNYSKVELGLRRLSYYDLKYLCESDVDIHYIFSNQRSKGKYNDFLGRFQYSELICYVSIIYYMVELRNIEKSTEQRKNILEKLRYVPLIDQSRNSSNLFLILRRSLNYQQKKMADILGVDIKKYRDLENGRRLPDSELLYLLYAKYQISPAVVLKDKKTMVSEISSLLEMMESGDEIFRIINLLHDMS